MKRFIQLGLVGLFLAALSFSALAAGNSARKEVNTAHTHAIMAENANSLKMAHAHLHHVINCLVGPNGAAFDTKAADPCKGMGNGAIDDASKQHAKTLKDALSLAQTGAQANSLKAAHRAARKAAQALNAVTSSKK